MLTDVSFTSAYVFDHFSWKFLCCMIKCGINEVFSHLKPLLESASTLRTTTEQNILPCWSLKFPPKVILPNRSVHLLDNYQYFGII